MSSRFGSRSDERRIAAEAIPAQVGYREGRRGGTRALAESGYSPEAMLKMLQRIESYQKEHDIDPDEYLAHHPPIGERIQAVKDLIKAENLKGNTRTMSGEAVQARQQRFNEAFGR